MSDRNVEISVGQSQSVFMMRMVNTGRIHERYCEFSAPGCSHMVSFDRYSCILWLNEGSSGIHRTFCRALLSKMFILIWNTYFSSLDESPITTELFEELEYDFSNFIKNVIAYELFYLEH